MVLPATGDQLRSVRHRLQGWLADHGVPQELSYGVVLITDEALTNAIEHGYRDHDGTGSVDLTVRVDREEIVVRVVDHGSWKPPVADRSSVRGRGLQIVKSLASHMDLVRTNIGTALTAHLPR